MDELDGIGQIGPTCPNRPISPKCLKWLGNLAFIPSCREQLPFLLPIFSKQDLENLHLQHLSKSANDH